MMFSFAWSYLFFFLFKIKLCAILQNDVNVADFSVDDIFNSDLMSANIITDQLGNFFSYSVRDDLLPATPESTSFNFSDLNTAFKSMRYHRKMMNEFLLTGFLSKEIVGNIPNTVNISEVIGKRSGKAKNISLSFYDDKDTSSLPSNHKLIEDEGSSQYSTWLKRMNTFEDIQKQLLNKRLQNSKRKREQKANRRQSLSIFSEPKYGEVGVDDELDYSEDGDITGYAFTSNPIEDATEINVHKTQQKSMMEGKAGSLKKQATSKVGYNNGYDDYTAPPQQVHNYAPSAPSKQSKEIGLKDISDIALTTLAFLSFGMFILQVLMCITMSKDDTSSMVMLPMEGTDNTEIPVDGNTEEIRRKRRSILTSPMKNIEMIDHLAKRALVSLKAVSAISEDDGACHHYSLCENNRFSRHFRDSKKLLMPAWSLGISWLTMELKISHKKTSLEKGNRVIQSLKALVAGLYNGNCSTIYKNKCKALYNQL